MRPSNLLRICICSALPFQVTAQSLLEEVDTGIIVEVLEDEGFSTELPTEVIELPPPLSDEATGAILRGLDRISGTVGSFPISVDETVQFERLEVTLLACRYPKNDISADAFAELEIKDIREDDVRFKGWMFASSPAVSALDHPRYDIWVLSCRNSGELNSSGSE